MELNFLMSYILKVRGQLKPEVIDIIRALPYGRMIIDSGAFSAHNSGGKIDIGEYMEFCHNLPVERVSSIIALDVIGDPEASLRNAEIMTKNGIDVTPTFHAGEPWHYLEDMARIYPKISLGGVVGSSLKQKEKFVNGAFARVWPHKIHGLAMVSKKLCLKYPFQSVDSSSWELRVRKFGMWENFNGAQLSQRGSLQNMTPIVLYYARLQENIRTMTGRNLNKVSEEPFRIHLAITAVAAIASLLRNKDKLVKLLGE